MEVIRWSALDPSSAKREKVLLNHSVFQSLALWPIINITTTTKISTLTTTWNHNLRLKDLEFVGVCVCVCVQAKLEQL